MKNTNSMNAEVMHLDLPEHGTPQLVEGSPKPSMALLGGIKVNVDICLGTREMSVRELLDMQTGAILELDRHVQQDVDVLLNGKVIARGQIVAVGDNFGLRVTDIPGNP
jgi:flagellar motor switch protein FliN/FliY